MCHLIDLKLLIGGTSWQNSFESVKPQFYGFLAFQTLKWKEQIQLESSFWCRQKARILFSKKAVHISTVSNVHISPVFS